VKEEKQEMISRHIRFPARNKSEDQDAYGMHMNLAIMDEFDSKFASARVIIGLEGNLSMSPVIMSWRATVARPFMCADVDAEKLVGNTS
jgi:hypothetical protein